MLSEAKIAKAAIRDKAYKLSDGGGLYIMITPAGGKLWRFNYRYQGRQKTLSIGKWPVISLQEARNAAIDAKRRLKSGHDPCVDKKIESHALLGTTACAWFERKKGSWKENTRTRVWWMLQKCILPAIGSRRIDTITPIEIDMFLRRIAAERSVIMAHHCQSICTAIFTDAVFNGLCPGNPAALMRGRLPAMKIGHFPTILDPHEIGQLLSDIDKGRSRNFLFSAWCALRLIFLVFVRPGEIRLAEWKEISLSDALWEIPAEKTKLNRPHLVPLSVQALDIIREMEPRSHGGPLVFPGVAPDVPFSKRAMGNILFKIGYKGKITPHGFRAMARTLLHERLHFSPDAIEAQLGHRVPDRLGIAYNRTQHMEERIRMMQAWADYLGELKKIRKYALD